MSFIYKCDVCGKDSAMTGVKFTPEELELEIEAYNGAKMKVKLGVAVEDMEDSVNIAKMETMLNSLMGKKMLSEGMIQDDLDDEDIDQQLYNETMFENLDVFMKEFKDKLMFVGNTVGLKLNTPNAMICDTCKRELAYRALTEGNFKQQANIFSYLYATDSMRMQPLQPQQRKLPENEETTEKAIVVIKRGSWYELPDGKKVRKKDLPANVIIKTDDDNKSS